ncbi:MAG: TlpA family protein disulfide reductase [Rhodospirillaceae bacterium]|nr:MAG: TlpA family protein disulfide reductase [Rhodospirillaceae bacterium]
MKISIRYKSLLVAGVIITAATAVASIALLTRTPPSSPAPAAESPLGRLRWLENPQPVAATPFSDESGTPRTLHDFAGRVLVVNFWATWCGPCVQEMPTLDALQATLGGDGFAVVAISQDRGGSGVAKPFLEANGWRHLALYTEPDAHFVKDAALAGLPTSLIVDRNGREVARLEGAAAWNSPEMVATLRKLMAAP